MPKVGGVPGNRLFSMLFSQGVLFASSTGKPRFLFCLLESREVNTARERQAFEFCFPSLLVKVGEYGRKESWSFLYLSDLAVLLVGRILLCLLNTLSLWLTEGEEISNIQIDNNFSSHDWFTISNTWKKLGVRVQERGKSCACYSQPCHWLTIRSLPGLTAAYTSHFPLQKAGMVGGSTASLFSDLQRGLIEKGCKAFCCSQMGKLWEWEKQRCLTVFCLFDQSDEISAGCRCESSWMWINSSIPADFSFTF